VVGALASIAKRVLIASLGGSTSRRADLEDFGVRVDRHHVVAAERGRNDGRFASPERRGAGIDDDRPAEHVHGPETLRGWPGDAGPGARAQMHGGEGMAIDRAQDAVRRGT